MIRKVPGNPTQTIRKIVVSSIETVFMQVKITIHTLN